MGILQDIGKLVGKAKKAGTTQAEIEAINKALEAIGARREQLRAAIKAADETRAELLLDDTAADRRRQLRADAEDAAEVLEALAIEEKSLRARLAGLLSAAKRERVGEFQNRYVLACGDVIKAMRTLASAGAAARKIFEDACAAGYEYEIIGFMPRIPMMGNHVLASVETADRFEVELSQSARALATAPIPAQPGAPVDLGALHAAHGNRPVHEWPEMIGKGTDSARPIILGSIVPKPAPKLVNLTPGPTHRPARPLLRIEGPIPEDHVPVKFIVGGAELSERLTAAAGDEIALPKSQAEMLVKHSRAVYLYSDDKKEAAE